MQFKNLTKLQLLNKLLSLHLQEAEVVTAGFSSSLDKPIALELNAFANLFALEIFDFSVLSRVSPFENVEPENLSPDLLLAGYELYLKDTLKKLGDVLDASISVSSYLHDFKPEDYKDRIYFYLHKDNLKIPLGLHFKLEDGMTILLSKLDSIKTTSEKDPDLNCEVQYIIGKTVVTLKELKSLKTGDGIALDEFFLKNDQVILKCNNYGAVALASDNKLTLQTPFSLVAPQQGGSAMADDVADKDNLTSLDDLNYELYFELDRKTFTLAEIKSLTAESVIELNNKDLSNIAIMAGTQRIGRGRIIDLGDRFGLQITEFAKND